MLIRLALPALMCARSIATVAQDRDPPTGLEDLVAQFPIIGCSGPVSRPQRPKPQQDVDHWLAATKIDTKAKLGGARL